MKNLNDKVVVITGAGSGIGRSLALKMYKLGAKLALNDLKKNALDKTLSMIDNPENIYTETFDVSVKKDFDLFAKNYALLEPLIHLQFLQLVSRTLLVISTCQS